MIIPVGQDDILSDNDLLGFLVDRFTICPTIN